MVQRIGDVDYSARIYHASMRPIQAGPGRLAAVASRAALAAGDGVDDIGPGIDPANSVVLGVHHIEIAGAIAADTLGSIEGRQFGIAAVAAVAAPGCSRDRRDRPVPVH